MRGKQGHTWQPRGQEKPAWLFSQLERLQVLPRACGKCKFFDPTSDLQNQKMWISVFTSPPGDCDTTLKSAEDPLRSLGQRLNLSVQLT